MGPINNHGNKVFKSGILPTALTIQANRNKEAQSGMKKAVAMLAALEEKTIQPSSGWRLLQFLEMTLSRGDTFEDQSLYALLANEAEKAEREKIKSDVLIQV